MNAQPPKLQITRSQLETIHETSLRVLEHVGMTFHADEAVDVFRRHGYRTDGLKVFFTPKQVEEAIKTAPREWTWNARNEQKSVVIGGPRTITGPGYGAPFVTMPDGSQRESTIEDYRNIARLVDALPSIDVNGGVLVEPRDLDEGQAHLEMVYASFANTDKPILGSALGTIGAKDSVAMAEIVFGSEYVRNHTCLMVLVNCLSPLQIGDAMLEALMGYSAAGQAVLIAPLVMGGITGPITTAGGIAQQNAELLATIALTQLIRPGTPVIYGGASTASDMKFGSPAIGSPEITFYIQLTAELARFHGLPSRAGGALSDSNAVDYQAGMESMMVMNAAIDAGISFVLHSGGMLSSFLSFSYEKLVLDNDLVNMIRWSKRPVEITEETLAFDSMAGVEENGNNFLMDALTLERYQSEYYRPTVAIRDSYNNWRKVHEGRDALARAIRYWPKLLTDHKPNPLPADVDQALRKYVEEHAT